MVYECLSTPTGVLYELVRGSYGYEWKTDGKTAKLMSGTFLTIDDAKFAGMRYCSTLSDDKQRLKYEPTLIEELDMLTKKDDLLNFAEKCNMQVPPALSRPTQIKKMLKDAIS